MHFPDVDRVLLFILGMAVLAVAIPVIIGIALYRSMVNQADRLGGE